MLRGQGLKRLVPVLCEDRCETCISSPLKSKKTRKALSQVWAEGVWGQGASGSDGLRFGSFEFSNVSTRSVYYL